MADVEVLNREEAAQLLGPKGELPEEEGPKAPRHLTIETPADIVFESSADGVFVFLCHETGSYAYTPDGLYCIGRFSDDDEDIERHITVPYNRLVYVEHQIEVLEALKEAYVAAQEEDGESSSD